MILTDGITINGKHSFTDFGLYIKERNIGIPSKNINKVTVPYMNGAYDFSDLMGAPTYGEREIAYTFDIIGATAAEMETEKSEILAWLTAAHDVDIYDDEITGYHFHGSYDGADWAEDNESGQLTVKFVVYPFKIQTTPTEYVYAVEETKTVVNNGVAKKPMITAPSGAVVTFKGSAVSVPSGYNGDVNIVLDNGNNAVKVKPNNSVTSFTSSSMTSSGITFTVNSDGTVTANGTATDVAWFYFKSTAAAFKPNAGTYRLTGCPAGGTSGTYRINVTVSPASGSSYSRYDYGEGVDVEIPDNLNYVSLAIRISAGVTMDNVQWSCNFAGNATLMVTEEMI